MGYFDNTRKNWIIGFLVLLNIGLLISLWVPKFGAGIHGEPPHKRQDKISRQFKKELNLTDKQFDGVKMFREEHFQDTRSIHQKIGKLKKEMFNALKGEIPDIDRANQIAEEIGNLEGQKDKLLIKHFLDLRQLCNPDQKDKLEKIFHNAMRKHDGQKRPKGEHPPPPRKR